MNGNMHTSRNQRGLTRTHVLWVLLAIFLLSPAVTAYLQPNRYEGGRLKDDADIEARNTSAFALILGEVRANVSDLLFVKTELYLHSGVAYMPHLDYEAMAQTGDIEHRPAPSDDHEPGTEFDFERHFREHQEEIGHEHHDHHEDEYAPTIIPTARQDFRGFIGELHRRVKPWRDPALAHVHTDGRELLPWYRLMTLSDPHHIRAYMIGAWWLKAQRQEAQREEAMRFLAEGIRNNPRAFQLYMMRGYMHHEDGNIEAARDDFEKAAGFAVQQRPLQGPEHRDWTDYMEDDARGAVRMHVLMERDLGNVERAIELSRQYREAMGTAVAFLNRIERDLQAMLEEE